MNHYQPPPYQNWPLQSPSHDPIGLEHRLTDLESRQERHEDRHANHEKDRASIRRRMAFHEKALLVIGGILQVLMQDNYPALAKFLKGILQ